MTYEGWNRKDLINYIKYLAIRQFRIGKRFRNYTEIYIYIYFSPSDYYTILQLLLLLPLLLKVSKNRGGGGGMVVNGKCSTTCLLLLGIIAAIYILLSTSKIYTCMYHVVYFKLT